MKLPRLLLACLLTAIGTGVVAPVGGTAAAQPVRTPTPQEELMMFFYKNPQPQRLVGFLEQHGASYPTKWDAYPGVAGFFAFIFRSQPAWIERLVPSRLNPPSATTVTAALRLSGQQATAAKLQSRLEQSGRDERLAAELANLPARLEDLQIRTPTHLDILWGASYASGDGRYARMILDFAARTANRSEAVAVDVAKTAIAIMGGPKEILSELRGKYGNDGGAQIIFAASAVWAARSNAERHAFIDQALTAYVTDHPGTPMVKIISVMRPKTRPP
jgi:hypothetical protein